MVVLGVLGMLGQLLGVDSLRWEVRGFLGTKVVRAEGFFDDGVGWPRLERSQWVRHLCCKTIGQSVGQVLHLRRWDQGDSQSFVTCSVHKDS